MFEVNGHYYWGNGLRMRNVLIVAPTRFDLINEVASSDTQFDDLDIIPSEALPHSEAIYITPEGTLRRFKLVEVL